jgi:hypothetical protein
MQKEHAVLVPTDLYHTDARYFPNSSELHHERFFVDIGEGHVQSEIKTIQPYGEGAMMCK